MFREWAILEPQRCSVYHQGGFVVGTTLFRAFTGIASDALLRREVQRALQERGWTWQIDLGYPVQASVSVEQVGIRAEGTATEYPGEALLRAYLGALRRN